MTLIVFEGIDGAGKSTQIKHIAQWLETRGFNALQTFEPTHGPFGQKIRTASPRLSPNDERAAFVCDRQEHVSNCILPALQRGDVVLCDRYYYSSMVYQGTRLANQNHDDSDEALDRILNMLRIENEAFAPQADILVIFDLSVDTSLARIRSGRDSADNFENKENLTRVAHAMARLPLIVKATSHTRVIHVDAERPVTEVTKFLIDEIAASFNLEP